MDVLFSYLSGGQLVAALGIAVLAGVIKGMVGFAMPMVLISGLSTFLPPGLALAGLILPTVVTNVWQAFRHGPAAAMGSVRQFRVFLAVGAVFLMIGAQLVTSIPVSTFLLMLGVPITGFALFQLAGAKLSLRRSWRVEAGVGALAGFIGGLSGVWGPPTVAYLTALNTAKADQVRIQGVIYGLGAVVLAIAHVVSGVLNWETLPLSLVLCVPAIIGMQIGMRLHDRIDQSAFRRATLVVLIVAGLNLIRRGVIAWG